MLSNTHYQPQQALKSISANVQQEPPLLSTLLADLERTQPLQKVTNMLLPASGYIQQQRSAGGARPAQHNWQQGDRQQHQYRQRQQNGKQQQQQSGEQQWPYRQRTDQKRQHSQQSPLGQLQPNIQPQPQQKWPYRQQQQQQQQRDTQQQQLPAITAVPGSRVGRLNMLIDLGAKLYLSTVPLLPQARRPHQPTVSKHVAAIGRLAIPFVEHPTPRQQVYMSLQEAAVLAKIVDVVYILCKLPHNAPPAFRPDGELTRATHSGDQQVPQPPAHRGGDGRPARRGTHAHAPLDHGRDDCHGEPASEMVSSSHPAVSNEES